MKFSAQESNLSAGLRKPSTASVGRRVLESPVCWNPRGFPVRMAGIEPACTSSQNSGPANGPHPEIVGNVSKVRATRSAWLLALPSAHRCEVPAAGVEPAPPRFQHSATTELASPGCCRDHALVARTVPRQGIEPCVCRLKAGCFAIEACEAISSVPGAGIEPATSCFKGRQRLPTPNIPERV